MVLDADADYAVEPCRQLVLGPGCWDCARLGSREVQRRKSCPEGLVEFRPVVEFLVELAGLHLLALADGKVGVARSRLELDAAVQLASLNEKAFSRPTITNKAVVSNDEKVVSRRPMEGDDLQGVSCFYVVIVTFEVLEPLLSGDLIRNLNIFLGSGKKDVRYASLRCSAVL